VLLDLDASVHADVHPYEYFGAAEDWFPDEGRGWSIWWGVRVRRRPV